jgi:hypothetical protein
VCAAQSTTLRFPRPFRLHPLPEVMPVDEMGWALKGQSKRSGGFTQEVYEFLKGIFDHRAYKVKEAEAKKMMEAKFTERDEGHAYYRGLVLGEGQIKAWLSSEKRRRQDRAAKQVVDQAITSLALDIDSAAPEEEVAIEDSNLAEVGGGGAHQGHTMGGVRQLRMAARWLLSLKWRCMMLLMRRKRVSTMTCLVCGP